MRICECRTGSKRNCMTIASMVTGVYAIFAWRISDIGAADAFAMFTYTVGLVLVALWLIVLTCPGPKKK